MTTDFTFGHHASSRFLKLLIINLLTCYSFILKMKDFNFISVKYTECIL